MRCHYVKGFKGQRVLIPGCMGTAVYGINRCTCGSDNEKGYQEQIHDLKKRIEKLESDYKQLKQEQ